MLIWEVTFTEKENLFGTAWSSCNVEADSCEEAIERTKEDAVNSYGKKRANELQVTKVKLILNVELPKKAKK